MTPELLDPAERQALVATRRELHAQPELAWEERRTSALIAARLEVLGYTPRGLAETGLLAEVGTGPRTVLLRADMDALPVTEQSDHPWRSAAPGTMHACGHDGHMAALLAVAARLKRREAELPGRVRLCFQPAEEGRGGAARMVAEGVLEGVDAVFGLHLWNELEVGRVGVIPGPLLAAVDLFELVIEGRGGHAALPHRTRDPILAASQLVNALQALVSRESDPMDPCVVSVGCFQAGENFNVIPNEARLRGTCRTFSAEAGRRLPERLRQLAEGVAGAFGCRARLDYRRVCPATVNDPLQAALVARVAGRLLGEAAVEREPARVRATIGEDFSEFLERRPGCFVLVGSRNEAAGLVEPHHSPRFDFDEGALPIAARLLEDVALAYLGGEGA